MRRDLAEVEFYAGGILRTRIWLRRIRAPALKVGFRESLNSLLEQTVMREAQISNGDFIHREPAHDRSPFGAHVGDGQTCIHREAGHAWAREFHRGVEGLVVVVQAAESDDDILAGHALGQLALQNDLNGARNLPPEFSCRPHRGGIRPHNRRAHGAQGAIHIRVGVRSDNEGTRRYITPLDHELMANPGTGRVEIDPTLTSECFDRTILLQVRFVMILYVMVEGEDELLRVVDLLCANRSEFAHHRRRVVMGHDVGRPNGDEVSHAQRAVRAISEMGLSNLLDNRLRHEISFASARSRRLTVIMVDEHRPAVL